MGSANGKESPMRSRFLKSLALRIPLLRDHLAGVAALLSLIHI